MEMLGEGKTPQATDRRRSRCAALAPLMVLLALSACAEVPTDPEERAEFERVNDPLEPMNRKIFAVNNFLDDYVMEPIARTYHNVLPDTVQTGIHNFLVNLNAPYVGGNEILQGKLDKAVVDLGRFLINSTFGIAGFWDVVADTNGPKANDTDIGLTLGTWGIGEGPFLMLPFFGPSNPRDAVGTAANYFADPLDAVATAQDGYRWAVDTRFGVGTVDTRVQLLEPIADLKRSSLDYYASVRSLYRQKRRSYLGIKEQADLGPGPAAPEAH